MLASDRREGIAPRQTGGERIGKLASQILRPPAARRRAPPDGGRMRVSALIAARNRATAARRRSATSRPRARPGKCRSQPCEEHLNDGGRSLSPASLRSRRWAIAAPPRPLAARRRGEDGAGHAVARRHRVESQTGGSAKLDTEARRRADGGRKSPNAKVLRGAGPRDPRLQGLWRWRTAMWTEEEHRRMYRRDGNERWPRSANGW